MSISYEQIKRDFPFLKNGVAYLDNASTTQKPQSVIDAMTDYYTNYTANVHRGIYAMSERTSTVYEDARETVRCFIHAARTEEIIFTSGTTGAINMLAQMLGQTMQAGDEIILSPLEHHANLIPWQLIAKNKGVHLKFFTLNSDQQIDPNELQALITPNTKLITLTHTSNVSGYSPNIKAIATIARSQGILTAIDGAQSVPHMITDVQDLGIDFLTFSGHKLCGPTGIGVLYGRFDVLNTLEPVIVGGGMIDEVRLESATWAELPMRLEPGTPNISGVIGLGAAIDYLTAIGMEEIHRTIQELYAYLWEEFGKLEGVKSYGPHDITVREGILSFTVDGVHPHDVASMLDQDGVACRAGHHCAQPLMNLWRVPATTRVSLYFYNTREDIDRCIAAIKKTQRLFL